MTCTRHRDGFTLVELLVVIGVIALLLALLLPALATIRQRANSTACQSNIRQILIAMLAYASANNEAIPGGSATTGRFLFKPNWTADHTWSDANCPNICQNWDWMSPLARTMELDFDRGPSAQQRVKRFDRLRLLPVFTCPENQLMAPAYTLSGGPALATDLVPSYATATEFHLLPNGSGGSWGIAQASPSLTPPVGYVPRLDKVGDLSRKVFIADGARYSNTDTPPDVDLHYFASGGGAFGDVGPFTTRSNCWNRTRAPGNGGSGAVDARIYAFRHGYRKQDGPADAYRFNVGFFDGHVQSMGDLEGSDPSLWLPKGTYYDPAGGEANPFPMPPDTAGKYGGNVARVIP